MSTEWGEGRKETSFFVLSILAHRAFAAHEFHLILPVEVLSLSQEKERNALITDKSLFLQTVIKHFAP